jgi:hypothetical protein
MIDWLVSIQLAGGGFQGGTTEAIPVRPVTFNTGQILIGLTAGVREFGDEYRPAMRAAATWLASTLDSDGCWRKHPTPFAAPGEKSYETHAAWGLFEAARIDQNSTFGAAALRNVRWALTKQEANGWFRDNCLDEPIRPLTHTLGYVLRGLVEAYLYSRDVEILAAARRTADGLLSARGPNGSLPGRLDCNWKAAVEWECLTGSAQIALCWLLLYQETGDTRYRDEGFALNARVRSTIDIDGPDETRGGVKGSFPVDGSYGRFQYLNWACKFAVDSNLLECAIRAAESAAGH